MDELDNGNRLSIDGKIMVELLAVALKYSGVDNVKEKIINEFLLVREIISLQHVFDWIIRITGAKCMIVNVDEANRLNQADMTHVIEIFGKFLSVGNKLYFSVSGIYTTIIPAAINGSSMAARQVILPALTMPDCVNLCEFLGLLTQDQKQHNIFFTQLLWLTGGVPRYIVNLVNSIAEKVDKTCYSLADLRQSMRKYVETMTHVQFQHVLEIWLPQCSIKLKVADPPAVVMNNIVSLCIAEMPVLKGSPLGDDYTIEKAMCCELLYIGTDGCVKVPPVLVSHMHNKGLNVDSCRVVVLQNLQGVLSSRDNESLFMSVMAHRLNALRILGRLSAPLSEILGVNLGGYDPVVSTVKVTCSKAKRTTTKANYENIIQPNRGEVNTPTAPFSDAYIR